MSGWTQRCEARNAAGVQCGLQQGHTGEHEVSTSAPAWQAPPPKRPISLRRVLLAVVGIVAVLYVIGRVDDTAQSTTGSGAQTVAGQGARAPHTVTGTGISNSAPFRLSGDYTVRWTATPDSDTGCFHGADLERADGELLLETLANELIDGRAPVSGTTRLYGLEPADYYVKASSGCRWEFTFTPN